MPKPCSKLIVIFALVTVAGCSSIHHVAKVSIGQVCVDCGTVSPATNPKPTDRTGGVQGPAGNGAYNGAFGIVQGVRQYASTKGPFNEGDSVIVYRAQNNKAPKGLFVRHCGPLYALAGTLWKGDRIAIEFETHSEMVLGEINVLNPHFTEGELAVITKNYSGSRLYKDLELSCVTRKKLDQQGDQL